MRILLDCRSVFETMGGIGRATAELARHLPAALQDGEELLLLTGARRPQSGLAVGNVQELQVDSAMIDPAFEQACLPSLLEEHKIDVVHTTCFTTPIAASRVARVATVHDVVFRRHPALVEPGLRDYLDRWTRVSCQLADAVVTVSEFSRTEIAALYGRAASAIDVVPNAVDDRFRRVARTRAKGLPYVLYVGSIEEKKNVAALLRAYGALLRTSPEIPHVLVLVGGAGAAPFDLERAVAEVPGIAPRVHALGRVPDDHLLELLGAADLFVYPSEHEGFGLPPLEAMAAGVPTIVSDRASLPEVVGDGAAIVDPHDEATFAQTMHRLLTSGTDRDALVARGRHRAQALTWIAAATSLAAVYRRVHAVRRDLAAPAARPALRVLAGGAP